MDVDMLGLPDEKDSGTLFVMDESGDNRIQWRKDRPDEVASARARFDELKRKNYLAYTVNRRGDRGDVIDVFDPNEERIIMAPQMVGG